MRSGPLGETPPFSLFGGVPDEAWLWLHMEGRESCPFLADFLPGLTDDPEFEEQMVGASGERALEHGFRAYELFKLLHARHADPLVPSSRVLDFGCGWGRIIRFFLREVAPENLIGVDISEQALAACRKTNRWCGFERCEELPPTGFEAESFDLVYGFSVFSHLSEESHARWLEEFERILRPHGVLLLTTFRRELFAEGWAPVVERFSPVEPWLSAYDRGEFCYRPLAETSPHFGFAFIPEPYVRAHWERHFDVREYLGAPGTFQNVIACTKRG